MNIKHFFDPNTWTLTYLAWDEKTKDAILIDPVLDFDPLAVDVSTSSIDHIIEEVNKLGLKVHYVLDTHAHADHLSAFAPAKKALGAKIGIGNEIAQVQEVFQGVFNLPKSFKTDGSQWDTLIKEGETLNAGSLTIEPIHTPGHTPACYSFKIGDVVFVGDVLFMPDSGTGRCDFPGGSAEAMYNSVQKIYALPNDTRLFVGHDYQPNGRELRCETTVADSKKNNIQLQANTTKEEFLAFRSARDATLRPPKLIFQALQVNINAGELPAADENGLRYLRLPLGIFSGDNA